METTINIEDKILHGKNAQSIRKILKERTPKSFEIKNKGKKVAQEVIQTVRLPHPVYMESAEGGNMTDVDGNTYIDTTMGFGPIILGHNHPVVREAVDKQLNRGWLFGLPGEAQFELGELLCDASPCAEEVIWANTGTEATMYAMRAARAFTGKSKIGVFDGAYHGAHDYALFYATFEEGTNDKPNGMYVSSGISDVIKNDTLELLPYRNEAAFDLIRKNKDDLAAIILEGSQNSNPRLNNKDFLQGLRDVCTECDVLMIMDEVVTGFRVDYGGIQGYYGIKADMATYGKITGGGFPVGAVAGRKDIMAVFGGRGGDKRIFHGGTFNGNPLSMIAGQAVISHLKENKDTIYPSLMDKGNRLTNEINKFCEENEYPAQILNAGSKFHMKFQRESISNGFDIKGYYGGEHKQAENEFYLHLLGHNVMVPGVRLAFLCDAHTDEDVTTIIESMKASFKAVREDGLF